MLKHNIGARSIISVHRVKRKVNKKLIERIDRILKMPYEEKLKRADEAIKAYAKWRKKTSA